MINKKTYSNGVYELHTGCDIIVDYQSQYSQDVIDFFEEKSNFEGFASLGTMDIKEGTFTIKEMPLDEISLEYLIVMNLDSNEYEYIDLGRV